MARIGVRDASVRVGLKPCVSQWEANGVNNVLGKLRLQRTTFTIPDDDLTGFLIKDSRLLFRRLSKEDSEAFDIFLRDVGCAIDFDIPDAVATVCRKAQDEKTFVKFQYGGFSTYCDPANQLPVNLRTKAFDDLNNAYMKLSSQAADYGRSDLEEIQGLSKYCCGGMDFVSEAAHMLMNPTEMCQPAFQGLFVAFAKLSGILLRDGAYEAPRRFSIFGVDIQSQPQVRAYIPVDDEHWWRQKPSISHTPGPPANIPVSAVVQVKLSPPEEGGVEIETGSALGQIVGEMLGELLSERPVADTSRLRMLGIMVLSTKVYFITLSVPNALMEIYKDQSSLPNDSQEDLVGNVAVSQSFDFLKARSRQKLLRILHTIGTISRS